MTGIEVWRQIMEVEVIDKYFKARKEYLALKLTVGTGLFNTALVDLWYECEQYKLRLGLPAGYTDAMLRILLEARKEGKL